MRGQLSERAANVIAMGAIVLVCSQGGVEGEDNGLLSQVGKGLWSYTKDYSIEHAFIFIKTKGPSLIEIED